MYVMKLDKELFLFDGLCVTCVKKWYLFELLMFIYLIVYDTYLKICLNYKIYKN